MVFKVERAGYELVCKWSGFRIEECVKSTKICLTDSICIYYNSFEYSTIETSNIILNKLQIILHIHC